MEYTEPSKNGYTIYSKSGCHFCKRAKQLLKEEETLLVNCDEYLLEDKSNFLNFIKNNTKGIDCKIFPMIFYKEQFIGGFKELEIHYNKHHAFDSMTF
jgi:glutaredoxin